ncbi:MAG: hypothetical protein E6H10_08255 [Bacteroidetes bacterium]|nr:MAG: hypothetical protein E6H10_08255 [Bacteroidota bacterium]
MKYSFAGIVASLLVVVLCACHKDKFETTPTIRVKDINSTEVNAPDGILKITLEVTDREGDAGGGDLTYIRVRTNSTPIPDPVNNDKADTAHATVPSYPKTDKVEMVLAIPYSFLDEDPVRNDTMYFKLTLRDSQNHQSDTITTKSIAAVQ